MALKKSDLYSSLWAGADELRGGMDASQYKDYVLTLLFVKYVSDKAKADPYADVEVPEGGSFNDLVALKGKPDLGEQVNVAIRKLADANDLQGVINNADFDDPDKLGKGKELVDRLTKLIGIFQDLDFTGSRAEGDDLLGDAYEYLMRHFASESGKSKGQFYTPAEVSRVMAALIGIKPDTPKSATVYDPTCGSGSLLLKVADAAPNGLTIYGQERDNATRALAVMNMHLHGSGTAEIRQGDTITSPQFLRGSVLQTFDYLVANPPFSVKSWNNGLENEYGRFDGYGRPPEKNGDYAFLLHMLKSLKSTGKGAVILPHGVLFRGNSEATIRKELIGRGYIKGIIGLPANLFYGTGIPACIIVLDKENAQARTGIFMIDASKGFAKDGNKNRLRPRDMHQIIDAFANQKEIERYSRMVPLAEIADLRNDYNLNIPRYIDGSEPEDIQDLHAHLNGGIPNRDLDALQAYWDAFPSLRSTLFRPLRDGYSELAIDKSHIQRTITGSAEYQTFKTSSNGIVKHWWNIHEALLQGITRTTRPADLIAELGDALLDAFRLRPLIDEYGVYEQLMSYWNDVMHDDVALIMGEGWDGAAKPRAARILGYDRNKKPKYETAHITFGTGVKAQRWVMDLVSPELIVARYFAKEQAELDALEAGVETAGQAIEEYVEEHAVEEGLLFDATDDDGKVTNKAVADRLKAARAEGADGDEIKALVHVVGLFKRETAAKKAAKEVRLKLDQLTLKRYAQLTTADIQRLVIDDKWGARVVAGVQAERAALIQKLVQRLNVLGARYEQTVGDLDAEVEALSVKVTAHLAAMGVEAR
ncbi:type I restriction-modification system modification subunit [Microlunatus phosphovorus NM-1]|uniref:site-specific DNA-methyltransferase (adenine-specific) n=1 Tax=Microlunatus phosphovorus (strain ATCC 700054 / DSM 10555 / JCM 9379 / NBRC 101784 / NCIMB 13414 / VKM Ac-1990 / NM-1) TaxID=1032480 RepID=F5XE55_MICPN|nr:class I SAM-dependent DNA methyltransferase [Microlunatus phosphovorus]BAK37603.1 type I restriction-modification system modification subunit [Microlunatus phosphovorus NM-1]